MIAQTGQRTDRDDASHSVAYFGDQAKGEHPATVFLLPGLDGVEVSLDQGFADEIARSATGTRRKVERTQPLAVRPFATRRRDDLWKFGWGDSFMGSASHTEQAHPRRLPLVSVSL